MPSGKQGLIFDTSGINWLADDPAVDAIVASICEAYHVRITETNLSEIGATKNPERRKKLLSLLKRLVFSGGCTMPYHWIIERLAKEYQKDPAAFDWRRIGIRLRAGEDEIARQEVINDLSAETRRELRESSIAFEKIFEDARPAFDRLFEPVGSERPSLSDVIAKLLGDGGAHWKIGAGLFERATEKLLSELEIRAFAAKCPPFEALLVGLCVAQYQRCIRGRLDPSLWDAGRLDMFSAVYLFYCDRFVTADPGQLNALSEVSRKMGLPLSILSYRQFAQELFAIGA